MATTAATGTTSGVHPRDIIKKYLRWTIVFTVLVVLLVGIKHKLDEPNQTRPKEKAVLMMPANGDSSRISAPPGYAVTFTGSGFTSHCVYTDGSEGIVGDQKRPCKDGPMLYQYVHDTTGKPNSVTYEFVRKN